MKDADTTTMLLRGARIALPDGVVEGKSLLVERGLIARITDDNLITTAEPTWYLDGLTLLPGFIDVHIHGAAGVDMMEASAADVAQLSQFLATQGVTGWLPTLVPGPTADYTHAIKAIDRAMKEQESSQQKEAGHPLSAGARMLGVHYEGPFVNSAQCGALRAPFFRTFSSARDIENLPTINNNRRQTAKHMITVAPEIAGGVELVQELHRRGWIVSIGHTKASFDVLDKTREIGAHHMTHFMNAMAPLHHRAPGPVAWGLSRDDVTCDLIADGVHLDPQMLRLLLKLKGADCLLLISDAIAAAGMGDGDYEIWGETITVKDGRSSNSRGALAGSVITMLDAVRLIRSLGVSVVDVARMAATNAARLLGIDQECGSIEEGKRADLVALDDAGRVSLTIVGGRVAFQA